MAPDVNKTLQRMKDIVALKNNRLLRGALPFITLMGLGYYGLTFMTDVMVKRRSARKGIMSYEEAEKKLGLNLKPKEERNKPVEEIFEKEVKTMDIDNWENKRGPRPWEPETLNQLKEDPPHLAPFRARGVVVPSTPPVDAADSKASLPSESSPVAVASS